MLKVGDKVQRTVRVSVLTDKGGFADRTLSVPAEVLYIHPEHRFYTVIITLPNGARYRETLYFGPKGQK